MTDQLPQKPLTTPIPANETERLAALHRYKILDTPPEAAFDRITTLAARLFDMPTALISLVDESRAWFKSCIGFDAHEVPRDATLCSFAVLTDQPLIIPDAQLDDRFACNPFVQSEPHSRFTLQVRPCSVVTDLTSERSVCSTVNPATRSAQNSKPP